MSMTTVSGAAPAPDPGNSITARVVRVSVAVGIGILVEAVVAWAAISQGWDDSKVLAVVGSALLALGAVLQAWHASTSKPQGQAPAALLDFLGWAMVCAGALSTLVAAILG